MKIAGHLVGGRPLQRALFVSFKQDIQSVITLILSEIFFYLFSISIQTKVHAGFVYAMQNVSLVRVSPA